MLSRVSDAIQRYAAPRLAWNPMLCSRIRFWRSACAACIESCPKRVLSWSGGIAVKDGCDACGICMAACRNGALEYSDEGDDALARHIGELLSGGRHDVFDIACSRCPAPDSGLHLSCLGRLTESSLFAPFRHGAKEVRLWRADCATCPRNTGMGAVADLAGLAETLARGVGIDGATISFHLAEGEPGPYRVVLARMTGRREFLGKVGNEAMKIAAALLPEVDSENKSSWQHLTSPRRQVLLHLLKAATWQSAMTVNSKGLPLGDVTIRPGCVGCPVCWKLCPTGALERVEGNDAVDIYFRPDACTGCRVCQEACIFGSISLSPSIDLQGLVLGERRKLIHLTAQYCKQCAVEFIGSDEETCPTCRIRSHGKAGLCA